MFTAKDNDKDINDLNKTIDANKMKDYLSSEATLRAQRDAKPKAFAKGGSVRGDGIAQKGRTRGKFR